jgi:hypothetical protein
MIRWIMIFVAIFAAAGIAATLTYEGSPVRAMFEPGEEIPENDADMQALLTGCAPWEVCEEAGTEETLSEITVAEVPLAQQHRTPEEVATWIVQTVSESLAMDSVNLERVISDARPHFHESAYNQYLAFMESGNLRQAIKASDLRMLNFVQNTPYLLTKGSADGRYKWLFEVPVMISFVKRSMRSYRGTVPQSREVVINVQVGRYDEADGEGLLIENFSIRAKARD